MSRTGSKDTERKEQPPRNPKPFLMKQERVEETLQQQRVQLGRTNPNLNTKFTSIVAGKEEEGRGYTNRGDAPT